MKDTIMVIDGYGQVGKHICNHLLLQNKHIIVAGRNKTKLNLFMLEATQSIQQNKINNQANQLNSNNKSNQDKLSAIAARVVDVANWQDTYLEGVTTVIMALEQNNLEVMEACTRCGVNYVDITPTGTLIEAMEEKREEIQKSRIVACIGVGIAPGISNVICENLARQFSEIEEINSYLMLGIGEQHGSNAVDWLVENLGKSFYVNSDKTKLRKSFSDGRWAHLQGEKRKRRYVRIDLADWHIMKK